MRARLKDIRVAAIMDQFTELCYESECTLCQLTPENWLNELVNFRPHLLFVESIWNGKNKLWRNKGNIPTDALRGIVEYCKTRKIPTMFWNKEDPFHYKHFLPIAWMFDFIFTTDIDSIPNYKRDTGNENVFFLHFAAQPQVHNPEEKYLRGNKVCFAGSYYKSHPEREVDFDNIMAKLLQDGEIDIYDRYYYSDFKNMKFPDIYKPFIVGTLPARDIDKAYKGYYYNLNVNTIKNSTTMFARRVFELMASNTIIVSNYAKGMETLFGNYIIASDNPEEIVDKLKVIQNDKLAYEKYRLFGLRNVLTQHLYEDRMAYLVDKIFAEKLYYQSPEILVYSVVNTPDEWDAVYNSFVRQEYSNAKMTVFMSTDTTNTCIDERVSVVSLEQKESYLESLDPEKYIACFVPEDYYGKHYLTDLVLALRFTNADVICKKEHYLINDNHNCVRVNHNEAYHYTNNADIRSALFKAKHYNLKNQITLCGRAIFAIDPFNYCENYSGCELFDVDDQADRYPFIKILELCKNAETLLPADPLVQNTEEDLHFWEESRCDFVSVKKLECGNIRLVVSEPKGKRETLLGKKILIDCNKNYEFYLSGAFEYKAGFGCRYYDGKNKKISQQNLLNATLSKLVIPQDATSLRLFASFEGEGTGFVHEMYLRTYLK